MSEKLEISVAEVHDLGDGWVRYVLEYWREGQGVQRPTFVFEKAVPFKGVAEEMRAVIEAQEELNRRPALKTPKGMKELVGRKI